MAAVTGDLLLALPTDTKLYLREWLQQMATNIENYVYHRAFQSMVQQAPDLVAELWDEFWTSRRPAFPSVTDMVRLHDILPYAHADMIHRHLQPVLLAAMRCSCPGDGPLCACTTSILTIQQTAGSRLLSGVSPVVWQELVALVSDNTRVPPVAPATLRLLAFCFERGLRLPSWSSKSVDALALQPNLDVPTLAHLLVHAPDALVREACTGIACPESVPVCAWVSGGEDTQGPRCRSRAHGCGLL